MALRIGGARAEINHNSNNNFLSILAGYMAVILSVTLVLFFGEIIPSGRARVEK